MKKYLIYILLCLSLVLCGCSTCNVVEEKPQPNAQQLQCEHEWVEINWGITNGDGIIYDIYCPKCQFETTAGYKEWNKIQADMEYRNNN